MKDTVDIYLEDRIITVQWDGNLLNDIIADSVLAVILQIESSRASVKGRIDLTVPARS